MRCALCSGNHPANYRRCTVYKDLQQRNKTNLNNHKLHVNSSLKSNNVQDSLPRNTTPNNPPLSQSQTYAQATQGQHAQSDIPLPTPDIESLIASFVSEDSYQSINFITYSGNLKLIGKKKMNNSVKNKSLLVLQFNANGLKNHVNIFQNVLYDKRIDIALITETHFTTYTHIFIPGYQLIKANHPDNVAHGGVAIFIKNSIHFQPQTNYCLDHIQSCTIIVKLNNIPITVGAFYSLPRHNILNATFTDYFNTIKNNFIIGGDFNAKHSAWGCRTNNPRGIVLYNFVNTNNFNILAPPGPTYWPSSPGKKTDILDIFVTKISSNLHCLTNNILDLNFDHSSVILNVSATVFARVEPPRLFPLSTDRLEFPNILNQRIDLKIKLKSNHEIDEAVNNLTMLIQSATWEATKPNKTHNYKNNYPIVSEQIPCLIVEKRRARAKYLVTRLPSHKTAYNKLGYSLKKALAKYKSYEFEKKLHSLSVTDVSLWRETKRLLKYKTALPPLLNDENSFQMLKS